MTRRLRRAVLVLGLVLGVVLQLVAPHAGGTSAAGAAAAVGTVAAAGQALALLQLRRRPVVVTGVIAVLYAVQVVAVDVVLPVLLWVGLWQVAALVPRRAWAVRATTQLTVAAVAIELGGELLHPRTGLGPAAAAGTVAVALLALLRRSERSRLEAVRAEGANAERLRIARDLHDLAGHGLSAVAVQSSTARVALDAGDEATARKALEAVEASSRSALKEMRELLTVLRDPGDTRSGPLPGLADVEELVERLRAGGVAVTSSVTSDPVPEALQLTAYRVVQEALTNAVRHAAGGAVDVDVRVDGAQLLVAVRSEGTGGPARDGASGVEGMRTRVTAAGGVLHAGRTGAGWTVEAALPLAAG